MQKKDPKDTKSQETNLKKNPKEDSEHNFVYEHKSNKGHTILMQHEHKNCLAAFAITLPPDINHKFKTL
jgi:hypothetical protein